MKKLLTLAALVAMALGADAQVFEVQKNGTAIAKYSGTDYTVALKSSSDVASATGHDYVEIGGLKWATMNIGAKTVAADAATSYGDYYAWGADKMWYTENTQTTASGTVTNFRSGKTSYDTPNAPYSSGSAFTKYISSDKKSTLEPIDDIAHLAWGGTWRMPTKGDFDNLHVACGGTSGASYSYDTTHKPNANFTAGKGEYYVSVSSGSSITATCGSNTLKMQVTGLLFCDGTNMVFFPAAGDIHEVTLYYQGTSGLYWSSSSYTSNTAATYDLYFTSDDVAPQDYSNRYCGFTVRPVSE